VSIQYLQRRLFAQRKGREIVQMCKFHGVYRLSEKEQVHPKVIWEERVANPTSEKLENALLWSVMENYERCGTLRNVTEPLRKISILAILN